MSSEEQTLDQNMLRNKICKYSIIFGNTINDNLSVLDERDKNLLLQTRNKLLGIQSYKIVEKINYFSILRFKIRANFYRKLIKKSKDDLLNKMSLLQNKIIENKEDINELNIFSESLLKYLLNTINYIYKNNLIIKYSNSRDIINQFKTTLIMNYIMNYYTYLDPSYLFLTKKYINELNDHEILILKNIFDKNSALMPSMIDIFNISKFNVIISSIIKIMLNLNYFHKNKISLFEELVIFINELSKQIHKSICAETKYINNIKIKKYTQMKKLSLKIKSDTLPKTYTDSNSDTNTDTDTETETETELSNSDFGVVSDDCLISKELNPRETKRQKIR